MILLAAAGAAAANGINLTIISSSWKLRKLMQKSFSIPTVIITNLLSYLVHDMSYDSFCGVNHQWCQAATNVTHVIVRWCSRDDGPKKKKARRFHPWRKNNRSSFELAIRKYPRGISSFIGFPVLDVLSLMDHPSYINWTSKVHSLSLSFNQYDQELSNKRIYETSNHELTEVEVITPLCEQLASMASSSSLSVFRSLVFENGADGDHHRMLSSCE
jgi:hypothetical protein